MNCPDCGSELGTAGCPTAWKHRQTEIPTKFTYCAFCDLTRQLHALTAERDAAVQRAERAEAERDKWKACMGWVIDEVLKHTDDGELGECASNECGGCESDDTPPCEGLCRNIVHQLERDESNRNYDAQQAHAAAVEAAYREGIIDGSDNYVCCAEQADHMWLHSDARKGLEGILTSKGGKS